MVPFSGILNPRELMIGSSLDLMELQKGIDKIEFEGSDVYIPLAAQFKIVRFDKYPNGKIDKLKMISGKHPKVTSDIRTYGAIKPVRAKVVIVVEAPLIIGSCFLECEYTENQ